MRNLASLAVVAAFVVNLTLLAAVLALWYRSSVNQVHDELSYGRAGGSFWSANSVGGYCSLAVAGTCPGEYPFSWRSEARRTSYEGGVTTGDDTRTWVDGWPVLFIYSSARSAEMYRDDVLGGARATGRSAWGVSTQWRTLAALLLLATALPGALVARAALRARRLSRVGQCRRCGYDLRSSPDRCPECGTAAPPSAGPAASAG